MPPIPLLPLLLLPPNSSAHANAFAAFAASPVAIAPDAAASAVGAAAAAAAAAPPPPLHVFTHAPAGVQPLSVPSHELRTCVHDGRGRRHCRGRCLTWLRVAARPARCRAIVNCRAPAALQAPRRAACEPCRRETQVVAT
eukprot:28515-Chlamydomonas_euryale.AAC.3